MDTLIQRAELMNRSQRYRSEGKPYHVWVLAGCGARGKLQVGVMERLLESEEHPWLVVGSSVGALNALGFSRLGILGLKSLWDGIRSREDVFADTWPWQKRWGWYDPAPLEKLIGEVLSENYFEAHWAVTYADLKEKRARYTVDNGLGAILGLASGLPPAEAVLASASIPGIVPPVRQRFVDGGVFEQCPLNFAIKAVQAIGGSPRITVILGNNVEPSLSPHWKLRGIIDTIMQSVDGLTVELLKNDVAYCLEQNAVRPKVAVRLIQPPVTFEMGALDFNPTELERAYQLGLSIDIPDFKERN